MDAVFRMFIVSGLLLVQMGVAQHDHAHGAMLSGEFGHYH